MSLTPTQVQELRDRLVKEEGRLKVELAPISHRAGERAGYVATFPDIGSSEEDNSFEVQEFSLNLDLQKKLEKDLALVRKALQKMGDGGYGVCERCKKHISPERLQALPEAEFCSECFGEESGA